MARLTIYRDNYVDSTVVSNCFIDEYMRDANDAQLKVYLYLIRMLNANQATSVSEIADKFNHTEKDVLRALKYWEKKKLLSLDFDAEKTLVGIHLRDLTRTDSDNEVALSPLVALNSDTQASPKNFITIPSKKPVETTIMPLETSLKPVETSLSDNYQGQPVKKFVKPSYSLDEMRNFKSREETSQLLFIAESYIGKPLSANDMQTILFFMDELHFSEDLIDYLIQYCVDRGKKDFRYIEKVAINWAEEGITTPKQAQKCSTKYDKNVYAIMNELGKNSVPTTKELEFITRWMKEYGFTNDIIFEACERTVLATDKHRFEYAEGILSNWKRENVHHKSDIYKIDDMYKQRRRGNAKNNPVNKFNQFTQNNYDFEELERELLSN